MTLSRRYIERKSQSRSYYDPMSGNMYSETSKLHAGLSSLEEALQECDTNNLYIWPMPKGTYRDKDSRYPKKLDLEKLEGFSRYYSKTGSSTFEIGDLEIDLFPMAIWFKLRPGDKLAPAIKAMALLGGLLTDAFNSKHGDAAMPVELTSTPATTSMDLLRRKLPIQVKYPNLEGDIEQLIMSNFSQARTELFNHGAPVVDNLHNYDGLWMYASCCRHVPIGPVTHDHKPEYLPYVAGFYRVTATVPTNWGHIGLLPMKNPNGGRSLYPNTQGSVFESWCSDKELRLALENGWSCTIEERILWPDTQKKGVKGQDPLRYWSEALTTLRQETIQQYPEPIRGYLKDAIRNVLNMGIGKLHAATQLEDVYTADFSEYPGDDTHFKEEYADGSQLYTKRVGLSAYQQQTYQPHWSLYVWCVCKWKLTKAALQVPYEQLVALRTDGIWTTCLAHFEDTGKVGCFRPKELHNTGPFPWPKHEVDFIRMVQNTNEVKNG